MDVLDFLPLVRKVAVELRRSLPSHILLDDMIQDGTIGLIHAFREHDSESGVPFHRYAAQKIRWAIQDGLRAGDWAERSVRGNANKLTKTMDELQHQLGRKPRYSEVAASLHLRIDDVATMMGEAFGHEFVEIDNDEDDENLHVEIPDSSMEPASIIERRTAYSRAVSCLQVLSVNERRAFILRVMCEMSGQQAAAEMGVSESRISQLHKIASEKIANCCASASLPPPEPMPVRHQHHH